MSNALHVRHLQSETLSIMAARFERNARLHEMQAARKMPDRGYRAAHARSAERCRRQAGECLAELQRRGEI